jgi:hypothetical protein
MGWPDGYAERMKEERAQVLAEAHRAAEQNFQEELQSREQEMAQLRERLKGSQKAELILQKQRRELEERTEALELEVTRQLNEERSQIRQKALEDADEQHRLKDAEKEQQIAGLRKQIDELKRTAEQGSQQLQGEVQELDLQEQLVGRFPGDGIGPVGKGHNGADVVQRVRNASAQDCGSIIWESKRTKHWQNAWLPKLRNDQRAAGADCAVIVSEVLPEGVTTFDVVDGVWVCSRTCAIPLAIALRAGLIEVSKAQRSVEGRHEKADLAYDYLCGTEFKHHISGIVESFIAMHADLDSEKRSTLAMWKKREKQLERVVACTAGVYGDLQGIVGATLPAIEGLEPPKLELAAAS